MKTQKNNGFPVFITQLLCFADLSHSSRLYPSSPAVVPRDILEPLEANTYSKPYGGQEDLDISDTVDRLRQEPISLSGRLHEIEPAWKAYLSAQADYAQLPENNGNERMATITQRVQDCSNTIDKLKQTQRTWSKYRADEPLGYALFVWLSPVRRKRERLALLFTHASRLP
ncbi:hypothetical protein FKG94_11275 [Exilibacterium tricleocarpae]|uniref:Uncharacterized protein n=1 Tax=Exilibacterium tricleocarpae TaxID=2591008 RepID=A0A545TQD8_9GAMM|nr:hypothetical protein [Exilibacterium tricleocarpae]TQV79443.1 hypothetical protein FKG94_11275 [Exilibacterium tricleocarpae]